MMVGAAFAALATAGAVWAQTTLVSNTFTDNETWAVAVGGPGGPSTFINLGAVRNTQGIVQSTLAAPFQMPNNKSDICITAQPASAANVTLPAAPTDGMIFEAINCTTSAFVTNVFSIVPSGSQTLLGGNIALTTLAAGASRELRYVLATNTWYPIR